MSETGRAPENPYQRPLGPIAAAAWSAAYLILFYIGLVVVMLLRPGSQHDQVNVAFLDLATVLLVVLLIARVHAPNGAVRDILGARPLGFLPSLVAAFTGVAMVLPVRALEQLLARKFPIPEAQMTEMVRGIGSLGARERMAGAILAALLPPIADELFFRGALATGVARLHGRRVALLTSSIACALVYATNGWQFVPSSLLVALLLGHARFATGSLLAPLAVSLAWHGADLAYLAWRFKTIDPLTTDLGPPIEYPAKLVVGATLVTVVLAALLSRFSSVDEVDPVPPQRQPLGPTGGDDDGDDDEGDS